MNQETFNTPNPTIFDPEALKARMYYAEVLSKASIVPDIYKGNPANVLVAIEYGASLGMAPTEALNRINIIKGRPTLSAEAMAALVRKAGHKLRISGDDTQAQVTIIRADDPDYTPDPVIWTIERAQKAGLLKNHVWKQYPAALLRARAVSEAVRAWAPDALAGVVYTPEEIETIEQAPTEETQMTNTLKQLLNRSAKKAAQAGMTKDQARRIISQVTNKTAHATTEITNPVHAKEITQIFTNWPQTNPQPQPQEEDGEGPGEVKNAAS